MKALSSLIVLLLPLSANAFETHCSYNDASCDPGPQAAQGRWMGDNDEHRQLLVDGLEQAGLPAALNNDIVLKVFVGDTPLGDDVHGLTSVAPANILQATRTALRTTSFAEMGQLPDLGYSLWDWASGFETCPIDDIGAVSCHRFDNHLGLVNAHHFLPQAQNHYAYYHQLAVQRGGECKDLAALLSPQGERLAAFTQACFQEAWVLEGISQHFLTDAWSSGHMWARWGSPVWEDFPDKSAAAVVALISGIIHGARAGLLPLLEGNLDFIVDVNDAMCAPTDPASDIRWRQGSGEMSAGVGDLYLGTLNDENDYAAQHTALMSCVTSSILQVYEAMGQPNGAPNPLATGLVSIDPNSDGCFSQRVSNASLKTGAALDLKLAGEQLHIPLTPRLLGRVNFQDSELLGTGLEPFDNERQAEYRWSAMRVIAQIRYFGKFAPDDTNLAAGELYPLLDINPNTAYLGRTPLTPYIDPLLPWELSTGDAAPLHGADALLHVFHSAHVTEWCSAFADEGESRFVLDQLRERAEQSPPPSAACDVCMTFAERHLRFGTSSEAYDTAREPLCYYVTDHPQLIYFDGDSTLTAAGAAQKWCGC